MAVGQPIHKRKAAAHHDNVMQVSFSPAFSINGIGIGLNNPVRRQCQFLQESKDRPKTLIDRCGIDISHQCIKQLGFDSENRRRLK
jgi:hypothetical protein